MLASGAPRRAALKSFGGLALMGALSREAVRPAVAAGNLGDHCSKDDPCNKPYVCINTECDHCLTSGTCHQGWCCDGYTCDDAQCVKCSSAHRGLGIEGCRKKDKKNKKDKKKKKKH
jgi:hypothetical protein